VVGILVVPVYVDMVGRMTTASIHLLALIVICCVSISNLIHRLPFGLQVQTNSV